MNAVVVLVAALAVQLRFRLCAGSVDELLQAVRDAGGAEFANILEVTPNFTQGLASYADGFFGRGSLLVSSDTAIQNAVSIKNGYAVPDEDWIVWLGEVVQYHFTEEQIRGIPQKRLKILPAWGPYADSMFQVGPGTYERSTLYSSITTFGSNPTRAGLEVQLHSKRYKEVEMYFVDKLLVPGGVQPPGDMPPEVAEVL